ncbi:outer membrane beta-barrel protein [Sphingomonas sp. LM7]|uniref:outer membrane beta-barrel protein n=1 Tax=Sphingomonas sp. LM7 TaxID=1938607 RepID=UPI00209A91BD|nr:outer membrane beta-barrel protein [Sphingomonas sp. LM7]
MASAHAQDKPKREQSDQGLRIEPSLTAVYDDNVYRVDSGTTDPVADVIVTPAIEVRFDRDIGTRAVSLRALAGYDRFLSESGRSKPRLELEGAGKFLVAAQCWVRPSASYRQQRADYGDINSASENLQKFSTLGVAADCERAAGLYPVAAWRRDTTRNGDGFEYADQTSNLYRAGIGYARPSLGKLTAYYEHVTSDRPELAVENRSDAYGLSFSRAVSPITSIDADVRWMHVTSTSAAVGSYDGPGWNVRLSTIAIPRVKLTAATERTIVNDSLIATGFAVRTAYRISAEVGLSELTTLGAFGELSRRDFRQDAAIRPFNFTHDRTNQFGLMARRKITDALALDLSVTHLDRATNSNVSNYRANRVSLGATMRF